MLSDFEYKHNLLAILKKKSELHEIFKHFEEISNMHNEALTPLDGASCMKIHEKYCLIQAHLEKSKISMKGNYTSCCFGTFLVGLSLLQFTKTNLLVGIYALIRSFSYVNLNN